MNPSAPIATLPHEAALDPETDLRILRSNHPLSPSYKQGLIESSTGRLEVKESKGLSAARKFSSLRTMICLGLDLLLAVPPICFLVYASMVYANRGKRIDEDPVPALRSAAKYGPTIFPIVFAAIMGNLLKAVASWKLERGISVSSLEYLLGSRTVFSTITTSFNLRTVNVVTLCLIVLWSLSPLGGQAAFRIVDAAPTTTRMSQPFHYLEVMSAFPPPGSVDISGPRERLPQVQGAFTTALSAPAEVKAATQDLNGNIKIPMLEALTNFQEALAGDNWLRMPATENFTYSAIAGLPISGPGGQMNSTFTLDTSYIYANCSMSHTEGMNSSEWYEYIRQEYRAGYSNDKTLLIQPGNLHLFNDTTPQNLIFTSYTYQAVTNVTCNLSTTYIEVEVFCHSISCRPLRIRPSPTPRAQSAMTVLHGLGPSGGQDFPDLTTWYLNSLVNATNTPWVDLWDTDPYSTPLEYYFTNPDSPYSIQFVSSQIWRGADIWPIGDLLFSQRFSQLLNTFWLANIAPLALLGNFTLDEVASRTEKNKYVSNYVSATAVVTPDFLVLSSSKAWMAILVIASGVMLLASVGAAVLGALRRGPDLLDRVAVLLRDSPYVDAQVVGSMEDGFDQARRLKDVRLCIGDARDGEDVGYVAVGTVGEVKPMSRVHTSRLYG